jgi:phosphopentomutase
MSTSNTNHVESNVHAPRPENLKRVFVLVVDAWGVGALPDAPDYQDSLAFNTMGSIDKHAKSLSLPNFERLGLGNILPLNRVKPQENPLASFGKMSERSRGKDTTTGHWEMAGIYLDIPFPTYPNGFPKDLVDQFITESGCGNILANKPASGTAILDELGEEHLRTGYPIVYTSADSVFQIAAHIEKVPLATLYHWCEVARRLLDGEHRVSRVIARPFTGTPGKFSRVGGDRRDYAVPPPGITTLARLKEQGAVVVAIGKIEDIFCQVGVTHSLHTHGNTHGLSVVEDLIQGKVPLNQLSLEGKPLCDYLHADKQFIFVNLVDTDMNFGHRRDIDGYAQALEEVDAALGRYLEMLTEDDLLMISADHGCDPAAPGSDHTREYVPILMYQKGRPGVNLMIRESFADLGQTVLDFLKMPNDGLPGVSLLQVKPPFQQPVGV